MHPVPLPTPASLATPSVLSVSELTRNVRALLEGEIGQVWVEGEISNHRKQASGHQYFTLKDDRSQLPCVLFRGGGGLNAGPALRDGAQVQVFGNLSVYEARGQYQLIVQLVQLRGVGALQAKFEALKRKLDAEGLFDPARKRPLPRFPLAIGVVTSPTGAALQDMLNVLRRRAPWIRVVVNPVRVQGQGAAAEIAAAVGEFNRWTAEGAGSTDGGLKQVDLIVVARGGGSLEDLWEFNEEIVARAIAASALPVVSAVGHEIDFTISDFAADLRAPTPSAAAELIAPDSLVLRRRVEAVALGFNRGLVARIERARERLDALGLGARAREPRRRLLDARQQVDLAHESLARATLEAVREQRRRLDERIYGLRLAGPERLLALRRQTVAAWSERVASAMGRQRETLRNRIRETGNLLRVLGPVATLERGYTITMAESGEILRAAGEIAPGQTMVTRFADGSVRSKVGRR